MVQNCEINETSIIQNKSSSFSQPRATKKSFSSRLTHLIRRDSSKSSLDDYSPKPAIFHRTQMIVLSPTDEKYISVKSSFKGRPLSQSKILGIFELDMPTKLQKRHEDYKAKLRKKFGKNDVTHRMFHGTTSICSPQRFVDAWNNNKENEKEERKEFHVDFCKKSCGLCGIIREGNKTKYAKTKSLFRKNRMWFASDPCTSLYYCNGVSCSDVSINSMFVIDVIEKDPNGVLIVDKEKATLPRFLILFETGNSSEENSSDMGY